MLACNETSERDRLLAAMPLTERRLELAGVSTAVLEGGDGPGLILLHGPGEFAAKWLRVIPQLVTTHRVIAPDLPGLGESATPPEPWTAAGLAAIIVEGLDLAAPPMGPYDLRVLPLRLMGLDGAPARAVLVG